MLSSKLSPKQERQAFFSAFKAAFKNVTDYQQLGEYCDYNSFLISFYQNYPWAVPSEELIPYCNSNTTEYDQLGFSKKLTVIKGRSINDDQISVDHFRNKRLLELDSKERYRLKKKVQEQDFPAEPDPTRLCITLFFLNKFEDFKQVNNEAAKARLFTQLSALASELKAKKYKNGEAFVSCLTAIEDAVTDAGELLAVVDGADPLQSLKNYIENNGFNLVFNQAVVPDDTNTKPDEVDDYFKTPTSKINTTPSSKNTSSSGGSNRSGGFGHLILPVGLESVANNYSELQPFAAPKPIHLKLDSQARPRSGSDVSAQQLIDARSRVNRIAASESNRDGQVKNVDATYVVPEAKDNFLARVVEEHIQRAKYLNKNRTVRSPKPAVSAQVLAIDLLEIMNHLSGKSVINRNDLLALLSYVSVVCVNDYKKDGLWSDLESPFQKCCKTIALYIETMLLRQNPVRLNADAVTTDFLAAYAEKSYKIGLQSDRVFLPVRFNRGGGQQGLGYKENIVKDPFAQYQLELKVIEQHSPAGTDLLNQLMRVIKEAMMNMDTPLSPASLLLLLDFFDCCVLHFYHAVDGLIIAQNKLSGIGSYQDIIDMLPFYTKSFSERCKLLCVMASQLSLESDSASSAIDDNFHGPNMLFFPRAIFAALAEHLKTFVRQQPDFFHFNIQLCMVDLHNKLQHCVSEISNCSKQNNIEIPVLITSSQDVLRNYLIPVLGEIVLNGEKYGHCLFQQKELFVLLKQLLGHVGSCFSNQLLFNLECNGLKTDRLIELIYKLKTCEKILDDVNYSFAEWVKLPIAQSPEIEAFASSVFNATRAIEGCLDPARRQLSIATSFSDAQLSTLYGSSNSARSSSGLIPDNGSAKKACKTPENSAEKRRSSSSVKKGGGFGFGFSPLV